MIIEIRVTMNENQAEYGSKRKDTDRGKSHDERNSQDKWTLATKETYKDSLKNPSIEHIRIKNQDKWT
jgi:hypothetical protein